MSFRCHEESQTAPPKVIPPNRSLKWRVCGFLDVRPRQRPCNGQLGMIHVQTVCKPCFEVWYIKVVQEIPCSDRCVRMSPPSRRPRTQPDRKSPGSSTPCLLRMRMLRDNRPNSRNIPGRPHGYVVFVVFLVDHSIDSRMRVFNGQFRNDDHEEAPYAVSDMLD